VASFVGGVRILVRTYSLTYVTAPASAISLLAGVRETGRNGPEDLTQSNALPPLTFAYTQIPFTAVGRIEMTNPPNLSLNNPDVSQIDINADGLPDLIYTPPDRPHEYSTAAGGDGTSQTRTYRSKIHNSEFLLPRSSWRMWMWVGMAEAISFTRVKCRWLSFSGTEIKASSASRWSRCGLATLSFHWPTRTSAEWMSTGITGCCR
jgi:hypothetical protein